MTESKTYTVEEAVETVEEFILATNQEHLATNQEHPDCDKNAALNLEVSVYTYGVHESGHDRHPICGLRVAEVSTWVPSGDGVGGAGASWMQTDAPHGIAVCAQAERCILALVENWDTVQDGEIQSEFWRLAFAMFGGDLHGDFEAACMKHAPGIPYPLRGGVMMDQHARDELNEANLPNPIRSLRISSIRIVRGQSPTPVLRFLLEEGARGSEGQPARVGVQRDPDPRGRVR